MIHILPILEDNYCYIIEGRGKECIVIDPGEAKPVEIFLNQARLKPVAILNTHHHDDHTAGNMALKKRYGINVFGPAAEMQNIHCIDKGLHDGDHFEMAGIEIFVIATPGHTSGHIIFYSKGENALFSGDTLFSMGCGRLMEGSAEEMFNSLQKIKSLPPQTLLYCGHEYTQSNGEFAKFINPDNQEIKKRLEAVIDLHQQGLPAIPVSLSVEFQTNPFLMANTQKEFAGLRARKDSF